MNRFHGLMAGLLACVSVSPALAIAGGPIGPAITPQDYTFSFIGKCADCEGSGRGTLKLTNYELGTDFDETNFVSFTYDGSNLFDPYEIDNGNVSYAFGNIGATPGPYNVSIGGLVEGEGVPIFDRAAFLSFPSALDFGLIYFSSYDDGEWSTGYNIEIDDYGVDGVWNLAADVTPSPSDVPEPASWAMMISGFGLIGASMRRRQRAAVSFG